MRVACVILAAGAGRRLGGVAKAALHLGDGRSFAAAVVAAARGGGCARVLGVVAAPHAAAARAALAAAGVGEIDENPAPERGMASSLAVALERIDAREVDAVLVWPVDHPTVRPGTVAALVAAAARDRVVVPVRGGRGGHPTVFGAELLAELRRAALVDGGARVVVAADPRRVVRLAVDDDGVVDDVDTATDLAALGGTLA